MHKIITTENQMKNIVIILSAIFMLATNALAGGNVALNINVSGVKVSNKAQNEKDFQSVSLSGTITASDAAVKDMPEVLPENIQILFKADNAGDKFLVSFCKRAAMVAKKNNKSLRIDIFMGQPDDLPQLIKGGMEDNRFNYFVLNTEDPRIESLSCSVSQ